MPSRNPDFDKIVQAYRDRYGVDLSYMRMKWSKHPVDIKGRRYYRLDDDETGAALSALVEAAPTSTGAADALEKFKGFDSELSDFLEQFEAKVRRLEADYFGA